MNNEIEELCMKYGTHIFNSININTNRNIEELADKYGTCIYHN